MNLSRSLIKNYIRMSVVNKVSGLQTPKLIFVYTSISVKSRLRSTSESLDLAAKKAHQIAVILKREVNK